MHEFSLAQALLEEVERVRSEHGGRLRSFRVEVGELAGVEPDLLASAVELLLADGPDEEVSMTLDRVPVEVRCGDCDATFVVRRFHFVCPTCGGGRLTVLRGEGLVLRDVTLEAEEGGVTP
jgi:hydrogenase nickel incorporation protein HypA/HybF